MDTPETIDDLYNGKIELRDEFLSLQTGSDRLRHTEVRLLRATTHFRLSVTREVYELLRETDLLYDPTVVPERQEYDEIKQFNKYINANPLMRWRIAIRQRDRSDSRNDILLLNLHTHSPEPTTKNSIAIEISSVRDIYERLLSRLKEERNADIQDVIRETLELDWQNQKTLMKAYVAEAEPILAKEDLDYEIKEMKEQLIDGYDFTPSLNQSRKKKHERKERQKTYVLG